MNSLEDVLRAEIRATGPITIEAFMRTCLLHPELGYYTTRDPFGAKGDFTTAPEISQMFGELLGLCLAQTWIDQGAPKPVVLAELGPGRGTLMADLLRATKRVPGFHEAIQLELVEASPTLRGKQRATISAPLTHRDRFDDLTPNMPLFLIANEFFDALPIRQFLRIENGWCERVIGLEDGALSFGRSDPISPSFLQDRFEECEEGDIVEICPEGQRLATAMGERITKDGGLALVVDYGGWRSLGDTFQALCGHEPVSPLSAPGTADLTAHVDFEALAKAAKPARATPMIPQGALLEGLGISIRAETLAKSLSGAALESHIAAYQRLTGPSEMGTLFKAMALTQPGASSPPGFEAL